MTAAKKKDTTVTSEATAVASEGAHDIRPLEEQTWAAVNLEYRDLPDSEKPHPTTIAQEQILPSDK
jgi:hypothetical protein